MTRRASLALFFAALALPQLVAAMYLPPSFSNLAGVSDVVVLGTIVKVEETTFTLRAEDVLAGATASQDLVIVRFRDWTCSARWKPYRVDQREVAFLQALSTADARRTGARYRLRSAGDEAEWEIQGDRVSVQGFRVPGGEEHDAGEHPGQWLPTADVLDALRTYRQCFSVFPNPLADWIRPIVHVICDTESLDTFRRRSVVHEYLAKTSMDGATDAR